MARFLYDAPAYTLTISGAGASIDSLASRLSDSSVASVVAFTSASGAQTTATTWKTQHVFAAGKKVLAGFLLGTSLPVGMKVTVKGKRAADGGYTYDMGGNSQSSRLVDFYDRSVGVWWAFDSDVEEVVGIEVTYWNDVGGSVALAASTAYRVGEIQFSPCLEARVQRTLSDDLEGPGRLDDTPTNQTRKLMPRPRRVVTIDLVPTADVKAWRRVRFAMATQVSCGFIPSIEDFDVMQDEAIFGTVTVVPKLVTTKNARRKFNKADTWDAQLQLREYPAA